MTYRVELNDDIVNEVVRFNADLSRAFKRCLDEIANDPWDRSGRDFEIEELDDAPPDEASSIVFTAAWFPAVIIYFAKAFTLDDEFADGGAPAIEEGMVRIFKLLWYDRT